MWNVEMAQEFPDCKVIGIDYQNAIMCNNMATEFDNLYFHYALPRHGTTGLEFLDDNSVDLLMIRDVWMVNSPGFKWLDVMEQAHRVLKPGGHVESFEQELAVQSPGAHFYMVDQWAGEFFKRIGIDRDITKRIGYYMKRAGLINIHESTIELPLGEWSSVPGKKLPLLSTSALPQPVPRL